MSDFKKLYKKPPSTFGKTAIIKSRLAQMQQEERNKSRTKILEKSRKKKYLPTLQNENNIKKLMEWKAERARKKKEEESQKKPPFIVGKVHHQFFSPPILLTNNKKDSAATSKKEKVAQADDKTTFKRGITKATEKRLKAKVAQKQKTPTTSSCTRELCTSGEKSNNDKTKSIDKRKSFAPPNHKFNPPAGLPNISLFGKVFVENSPPNKNICSYDKSIEKVSSTIQNHNNSDSIESIVLKVSSDEDEDSNFSQNENFSQIEEKEHSIKYFKRLSCKEKDRLQKVCDKWTTIQSQDNITEDIRYQINQAVGQTTMLIKEKFEQFRHLILLCKESKDAEMKVTCTDLHGFWDMMYIQVKDCDSRFAKLEKLRAGNWREQLLYIESPSARNKTVVKTLRQSSLRTSILAIQWKKKLAKIRDAKEHSLSIKVNDIFITPSNSDRKAAVLDKSLDVSCRRKLLESHTHKMYTSTPFITMKVSKFHRPSNTLISQFNNEMLHMTLEQTPRKNAIETSEKPRNLESKFIHADLDLNLTILSNDELKDKQKSRVSSIDNSEFDEINFNKYIDREKSSSSNVIVSSPSSCQTIIETTLRAN